MDDNKTPGEAWERWLTGFVHEAQQAAISMISYQNGAREMPDEQDFWYMTLMGVAQGYSDILFMFLGMKDYRKPGWKMVPRPVDYAWTEFVRNLLYQREAYVTSKYKEYVVMNAATISVYDRAMEGLSIPLIARVRT